jgi:hypothetical protein
VTTRNVKTSEVDNLTEADSDFEDDEDPGLESAGTIGDDIGRPDLNSVHRYVMLVKLIICLCYQQHSREFFVQR